MFAPGAVTANITIPIISDNNVEPNEYFDVELSSAINAIIADGLGRVTIVDGSVTTIAGWTGSETFPSGFSGAPNGRLYATSWSGGEFGFGAEIGISTDKLHARGPMALEELTAYKYVIRGEGQIRE